MHLTFNRKKSQLFTIVVKHEDGFGIPAGFLITNKSDHTIIADWLKQLAIGANGAFEPSVAITDQGSTEMKAIKEAFPQCKIFLCIWHVLKAWQRNCGSKGVKDEKEKVVLNGSA